MSADLRRACLLGLDGGQTSTIAVLADGAGEVLGIGHAGSANHYHEPGGPERLHLALTTSIGEALADARVAAAAVTHACIGLSGGAPEAGPITAALLPGAAVEVVKDSVTSLAGASAGSMRGVIVIAGTGSVAYGLRPPEMGKAGLGAEVFAGGWGYLMGDEGSAYDIGRRAMRAAARASDGRGPATALLAAIPAHLDCADLRAVHRLVYGTGLPRPAVAELAALVAAWAGRGDAVATSLMEDAGRALAASAAAVIAKVAPPGAAIPVYPIGGVFRAGAALMDPFRAALAGICPSAVVTQPAFGPAAGALLRAARMAGLAAGEVFQANLQRTMPAAAGKDLSHPGQGDEQHGAR